jgi:hemoglobin
MDTKHDILTMQDIKMMTDNFYARVRKDELLGHIFEEVIQDRWEQHLEKMYRFWQTILFSEQTYSGSPFLQHTNLPVEDKHFTRWTEIFKQTVDDFFCGKNAEEAKLRAETTAGIFAGNLKYMRMKNDFQP